MNKLVNHVASDYCERWALTGEKFCGISSRESIFLILAAGCNWLASLIINGILRFMARPRCWLTIVTKNWINYNMEKESAYAAVELVISARIRSF